jgi:hypothetical protein
VHQGAALLVEPLPTLALERVIEGSTGPVLVLDQVTDPRNVGAILRSAAAFGAAAMILQDRHAPQETGSLARAASGALEVVPILREVNLARAIQALKKAGLWVVGLEAAAPVTLAQSGLQTLAEAPHMLLNALTPHFADAGQRGSRADTVGPVAAGDETVVRGVHDLLLAHNRSGGIAVAHRLRIHGDVRLDAGGRRVHEE